MEDSHIAQFNIAPDVHIFGVFDGHGGENIFSDYYLAVFAAFNGKLYLTHNSVRQGSRSVR